MNVSPARTRYDLGISDSSDFYFRRLSPLKRTNVPLSDSTVHYGKFCTSPDGLVRGLFLTVKVSASMGPAAVRRGRWAGLVIEIIQGPPPTNLSYLVSPDAERVVCLDNNYCQPYKKVAGHVGTSVQAGSYRSKCEHLVGPGNSMPSLKT